MNKKYSVIDLVVSGTQGGQNTYSWFKGWGLVILGCPRQDSSRWIIVKHCLKNKFTRGPDIVSRNGKCFEDIL